MTKKSHHSNNKRILLATLSLALAEKGAAVNTGYSSFVPCRRKANFGATATTTKSFQRLLVVQQYRNETIGRAADDYSADGSELVNPDCAKTRNLRTQAKFEAIENEQTDYVGAGTFGDIMSDPADETDWNSVPPERPVEVKSGLVTSAGGTLQSQFGHKISSLSPLDRIALTANGNLQRIFSSYYDAPVHVHVDKCDQEESSKSVWHRRVSLSVFGQTFCTAESVVTVHSSECSTLVKSGEVGIGQLFRYLDKLPKFTIIDAGRSTSGGLWRCYTLQCDELTCDIREEFSANAWQLRPRGLDHFDDHDNTF